MVSALNAVLSAYFIFDSKPSQGIFRWYFFFRNFFTSYIDAMAEGISSMVTKLSEEIESLEALDEDGEEQEGDNSMNALGIFNSMRSLFISVMMFLGGWVTAHTDGVRVSGIILSSYPTLLVVLVLIFFKEEKVKIGKKRIFFPIFLFFSRF